MDSFIQESIKNMQRTETSTTYSRIRARMLHAIMGIADESGELVEIMLRARFYDQPVDITHYKNELGDLWWYLCLAVDDLAETENKTPEEIFREILSINRAKLLARYPEKYSDEQARERNLDAEKEAVQEASKE